MKFEHTLIHITKEGCERSFDVVFSYDYETDTIIKEELSGNWRALDENLISEIIKYAIFEQNYNDLTFGNGNNIEFTYPVESYYEAIGGKENAKSVYREETSIIDKIGNQLTKRLTNRKSLFRK